MAFKVDDCVAVKKGTKDPDSDLYDLSGWQGIILEIGDKDETTGEQIYLLVWDSMTLRSLPEQFIIDAMLEESDYATMYLGEGDLEPAKVRDTHDEIEATIDEIDEKYYWAGLGEEGKRIEAVIKQASNKDDFDAVVQAWKSHLEKHLVLPCDVVSEEDDKAYVLKAIVGADDNGILGLLNNGTTAALCDLIPEDEAKDEALSDYLTWFANQAE